MSTFAIQHGPTALCTWDLETGAPAFHERATHRDGLLVVRETDKLGFVLNPAPEGLEHRIFVGDVPLSELVPTPEDAAGVALGGQLFWRDLAYFESARGQTGIMLEARPEDRVSDTWQRVLDVRVYVLPSKLGEERYQRMANDLQELSRGLLVDLYGKSTQTHDLRFAKEGKAYHSRERELESIEAVLDRLGTLLRAIRQRPASRVQTVTWQQSYWGGERLTPAAIDWLSRRGTAPSTSKRPLAIRTRRRVETFDVPEHRVARAFLEILIRRADYCAEVARRHVRAIASDQHLRDVRLGDGPTIYESVDLPRIKRLEEAVRRAERSASLATAMTALPFLSDVPPELVAVRGGTFQRSPEYRALFLHIRRFLLGNALWYEGDEMSAVTKLTSRLFEQWCYLQTVEAFRACGLDLREWGDALRQNVQSRLLLDFDRGLTFEGILTPDLRLRFRYEPWILGADSASRAGETLCRGSSGDVAWCPDIVIECLRQHEGHWRPVYGIVLDSKYTETIRDQHWHETSKYLEIRSTHTRRQVVRQLWLIAPGEQAFIGSEDPAVSFDETGPSCASDEAVRFRMAAAPPAGAAPGQAPSEPDAFTRFARGTMAFLKRTFAKEEASAGG